MLKRILSTAVCFFFLGQANGQMVPFTQTINAAGGSAALSGNYYEWSVGEMALVSTFSTPNIIVTQGLLQPTSEPSHIANKPALSQMMQVYPNPAQNLVHLGYKLTQTGRLSYELQDMTGRRIAAKTIQTNTPTGSEKIELSAIANGTYMLNVVFHSSDGATESTSFKIDKIEQY